MTMMRPEESLPQSPSSYLEYLPAPYQGDEFAGRFLCIFESVMAPVERMIDNLPYYFQPRLTPEDWLPWIASWVAEELDENWSVRQRRELAARAAILHRWRGTRRAINEHVELYTGRKPVIVENFKGLRLGADAVLGVNTALGTRKPHTIDVTVFDDGTQDIDVEAVHRIVELETPAHVDYTLRIVRLPLPPMKPESDHSIDRALAVDDAPVPSGASA